MKRPIVYLQSKLQLNLAPITRFSFGDAGFQTFEKFALFWSQNAKDVKTQKEISTAIKRISKRKRRCLHQNTDRFWFFFFLLELLLQRTNFITLRFQLGKRNSEKSGVNHVKSVSLVSIPLPHTPLLPASIFAKKKCPHFGGSRRSLVREGPKIIFFVLQGFPAKGCS